MVEYNAIASKASLDEVFSALAHPVRRSLISRLAHGEESVMRLAEPFPISLNAVSKHLKALEAAKLVKRRWEGRVAWVSLDSEALVVARDWIDHYHEFWTARLDALESYLDAQSEEPDE
ncbi:MAG: winged helix-turn-helix transcriptional regulator [Myxococcales bacterium]|nr:winged helix-turn-helix transcriptional regulator [Myxococcales bacterium]